jgi:hypothetical protein
MQCTANECQSEATRLIGKRPGDQRGNPRSSVTEGVGPLCIKHYSRLIRTGSVDTVRPHPSGPDHVQWKGASVDYHAVHERLYRRRGRARDYPCAKCGGAASQWAYDHSDPDQLCGPYGPYSVNLDLYSPMCVPCHKRMDLDRLVVG